MCSLLEMNVETVGILAVLFASNSDYGARRHRHDSCRDTSEKKPSQPGSPVCADHQKVSLLGSSHADNLTSGLAVGEKFRDDVNTRFLSFLRECGELLFRPL